MAAPFKELRFTRSGQAVTFLVLGLVCLAAAVGIGYVWWQRIEHRPAWWLGVVPLLLAGWSFRTAWRLTRHAYLLLTPLGVEIFPFFRPDREMQLVTWGEIERAEVDEGMRRLTLVLAGLEDARIIVTLEPVASRSRPLLAAAVRGVMAKREEAASAARLTDGTF